MIGALAVGRGNLPGTISAKETSMGRVAIGIAKGTAMIVVGVPVVTVCAGLGATAIVAYGLASPFVYGGKKLVRKIRRKPGKKKRLSEQNVLTLEPIDDVTKEDEKVLVCYAPTRQTSVSSLEEKRLSQSLPARMLLHDKDELAPPPFRRMVSREKGALLPPPVLEDEEDADLWSEMESVVHSMEPDRASLPDSFVPTDIPLNLDSEQDIIALAERMQLAKLAGPETLSLPDLTRVGVPLNDGDEEGGRTTREPPVLGRQTTYRRLLSNLSDGTSGSLIDC